MPQEPAYAAERSQDGEAKAASSERRAWMPVASVRRRGVGSPELTSQEADPPRNRLACGVQTVSRTRSVRTTDGLVTAGGTRGP
jgi:hypothetical protein